MDSGTVTAPFGRYVLKERLAQGGMGEVFRAVAIGEQGFEKPVVIKRVLPAHAGRDDLAELFVAEAKLMTRLAHPNIVEVLDFGRGEQRDYYLVLELVDGVDLGRLCHYFSSRSERFPAPLALFVAAQVLRGLHHAHKKAEGGVLVHRDVTPSNVLLSAEGEVKVADFGVALVRERAGAVEGGGGVAGKPGYMAPECEGGDVDPRADVFSVGVVLFQMLAGRLPFEGDTWQAQLEAARAGRRPSLPELRDDVSPEIEAIVARALSPDREARFADARAMAQAIEGQPIATSDDLAEVVRSARAALPAAGRKVIGLSDARSPDDEPRELTRTGGRGGLGAFTLAAPRTEPGSAPVPTTPARPRAAADEPGTVRLPADREPLSPVESPDEAPGPRSRSWDARRGVAAAVVAAGVLAVVAFSVRRPTPASAPPPVAVVSVPVPVVVSAPPQAPAPPPIAAPTQVAPAASAPHPADHPAAARAPSAHPVETAAVTAATSTAPAECTGRVHISSIGSWNVSGGPQRVQSPGWYTWRCGTFSLVAESREDPDQRKSASVTVREGGSAEVDLR